MMLPLMTLTFTLSVPAGPEPDTYPLIRLLDHVPPISGSTHASPEDASAFVQAGSNVALPHTPPVVVMTAREDMRPVSVSIAFNWVWLGEGQERRPVWFARLRAANGGRSIERFADSRQCAGVEQSLAQLDGLPALDPRVPGLPNPAATILGDLGGYLHDNTYQIRLRGLFEGETYTDDLAVTGRSSSPMARIVAESLTRLLPCWTETPPPRA